jgi:hypothetical protein
MIASDWRLQKHDHVSRKSTWAANDSTFAISASGTSAFGHTDTADLSVVSSSALCRFRSVAFAPLCIMMAHAGAGMLTGVSCSRESAVGSVTPQRSRCEALDKLQMFASSPTVECAMCHSSMYLPSPGARCCTGCYTFSRALLAARSLLCNHASVAGEIRQDCVQPTPAQRFPRRLRPMHIYNWPPHCYRSETNKLDMRLASRSDPCSLSMSVCASLH